MIIADDLHRGQDVARVLRATVPAKTANTDWMRDTCKQTAEAVYGHMLGANGQDNPPRSEKAFYVGCSGFSYGGIEGKFHD